MPAPIKLPTNPAQPSFHCQSQRVFPKYRDVRLPPRTNQLWKEDDPKLPGVRALLELIAQDANGTPPSFVAHARRVVAGNSLVPMTRSWRHTIGEQLQQFLHNRSTIISGHGSVSGFAVPIIFSGDDLTIAHSHIAPVKSADWGFGELRRAIALQPQHDLTGDQHFIVMIISLVEAVPVIRPIASTLRSTYAPNPINTHATFFPQVTTFLDSLWDSPLPLPKPHIEKITPHHRALRNQNNRDYLAQALPLLARHKLLHAEKLDPNLVKFGVHMDPLGYIHGVRLETWKHSIAKSDRSSVWAYQSAAVGDQWLPVLWLDTAYTLLPNKRWHWQPVRPKQFTATFGRGLDMQPVATTADQRGALLHCLSGKTPSKMKVAQTSSQFFGLATKK